MRTKQHIARAEAFSVLEVTIAMALVSLLSALFFNALNRFGEQVKTETDIRNELNQWYVVRANLWRELDEADSIHVEKDLAHLFLGKNTVEYHLSDNRLFRKVGEEDNDLRLAMNGIRKEARNGHTYIAFLFDWKQTEMVLRYPVHATAAEKVNQYFETEQWR